MPSVPPVLDYYRRADRYFEVPREPFTADRVPSSRDSDEPFDVEDADLTLHVEEPTASDCDPVIERNRGYYRTRHNRRRPT